MPHGDGSDIAALVTLAGAIQQIFYPELHFAEFPPLKSFFDAPPANQSAELVSTLTSQIHLFS